MTRTLSTTLLAAVLLATPVALACPDCPAARAARVEVFDRDFGRNLFMALAPFLVVGVVATSLYRSGGRNRLTASGSGETPRASA